MKRTIAFLLAVLMLLPLTVSCGEEAPATQPAPEAGAQTPPAIESLEIIKNGNCNVYYDKSSIQTQNLNAFLDELRDAGLSVTATQVYRGSKGLVDGQNNPVTFIEGNAILVGNVELPEGGSSAGALRKNDYMVGIQDGYFIIGGLSNTTTVQATSYFTGMVLGKLDDSKSLTFAVEDNYRINGTKYTMGDIEINGLSLGHYKIHVSPKCSISEWRTAVQLREYINNSFGYKTEIVRTETCNSKGVIRIGAALCTTQVPGAHDYAININGNVVELVAESVFGYTKLQSDMKRKVFYSDDRENVKALDNTASITGNGATVPLSPLDINGDVRIMYNNIHGQIANGNLPMPVQQPTEMLVELYLEYLPDVIGLQECTAHSFNAGIVKLLSSEYDMVYDTQTATAMFYRRATVELLESGYYGFNDIDAEFADENHIYKDLIEDRGYATTDIYHNNKNSLGQTGQSRKDSSKGVTWGIFRLKSTGNVFMAGSTHLWWENNEALDDITRMVQMRKLRNVTSEAAAAFAAQNGIEAGTIPIFIGGDYNTEYGGTRNSLPTMESTVDSYPFSNVNRIATQKLETTTHHAYATYDKDLDIYVDTNPTYASYEYAIDHIFVNKAAEDLVNINLVDRLEDDYAYLSSDHLAIFTDVTFNATAPKTTN